MIVDRSEVVSPKQGANAGDGQEEVCIVCLSWHGSPQTHLSQVLRRHTALKQDLEEQARYCAHLHCLDTWYVTSCTHRLLEEKRRQFEEERRRFEAVCVAV